MSVTVHTDGAPPQSGIWTLTAPDGREWKANHPLQVVGMEQRERVSAGLALERISGAIKPIPCWCPYCGEPHSTNEREADPRSDEERVK